MKKLYEQEVDLITMMRFVIQLSYYTMSYLRHPLQLRAGGGVAQAVLLRFLQAQ